MAQATAIVVNDGATTPVAVTFSPEQVMPSESVFVDRRKTARALQPTLTARFSRASAKRKTYRPSFQLDYPIEGLVDGVAAPVDVARADLGFVIPENMPLQDRKHLFAFIVNGAQVALFKSTVVDLDPPY